MAWVQELPKKPCCRFVCIRRGIPSGDGTMWFYNLRFLCRFRTLDDGTSVSVQVSFLDRDHWSTFRDLNRIAPARAYRDPKVSESREVYVWDEDVFVPEEVEL